MSAEASRLAFGEVAATGISPAAFEQFKLDRLFELRAMVEALRGDRGHELSRDAGNAAAALQS